MKKIANNQIVASNNNVEIETLIPTNLRVKTEFRGGSFSRTFLLEKKDKKKIFVRKIGLNVGNIKKKLKFQYDSESM